MACIVHYENYVLETEKLLPLTKDGHERLLLAAASRLELGGGNIHEVQSSQIPKMYIENLLYHSKCYKKFTSAISVAKKSSTSSSSKDPTRSRRSGEQGSHLLPPCCMFCMKETPRTVNHKKQDVRKITLQSTEERIRLAAELKKDERLLAVIRGTNSLLAAEFMCHEKCHGDYVRCVPARKKREKTIDTAENLNGSFIGSKILRKRLRFSKSLLDKIDEVDTDTIELSESTLETALEPSSTSTPLRQEVNVSESSDESCITVDCELNTDFLKGDKERLHKYVLEKIIRDNNCVSMKILTDVYGFNGNDRKKRFYV